MPENPLNEVLFREEELNKCVNCGVCHSVCPTYLNLGREGLTARGKIFLLRAIAEGRLKPTKSVADEFDDCLACYACQTVCPANVRTEKLWTTSRQDLAKYSSTNWKKKLGFHFTIRKPRIFNFLIRLGGFLGYDRKVDFHKRNGTRELLPFKGAPYLFRLRESYEPDGEPLGSVALLLGCSVNIYAPEVVDAVIKLLVAGGWSVKIPRKQVCCGAPAINNGDWNTARKLAKKNLKVFTSAGTDYITSCDATCGGALGHDYSELFLRDKRLKPEFDEFSGKVVRIDGLIHESIQKGRLAFGSLKRSITLHDSCHSIHTGPTPLWREILSQVPEINLVEMDKSDHCCGFGGSYMFFHPKTSVIIADQKLQNAARSGAEEILVSSPGCMIRLKSLEQYKKNTRLKIRHIAELLAECINTD